MNNFDHWIEWCLEERMWFHCQYTEPGEPQFAEFTVNKYVIFYLDFPDFPIGPPTVTTDMLHDYQAFYLLSGHALFLE